MTLKLGNITSAVLENAQFTCSFLLYGWIKCRDFQEKRANLNCPQKNAEKEIGGHRKNNADISLNAQNLLKFSEICVLRDFEAVRLAPNTP